MELIGADGNPIKQVGVEPEGAVEHPPIDEGSEEGRKEPQTGEIGKAPAPEATHEAPESPMKMDMTRRGWMTLSMNLEHMSQRQETIDQFIGFMERNKQYGLQLIAMIVRNRETLKRAVIDNGNKGGFRNFINKINKRR